jgi:hypothetical protein
LTNRSGFDPVGERSLNHAEKAAEQSRSRIGKLATNKKHGDAKLTRHR